MKYYVGADLGTSSLKLMLVDASGGIIKSVTREYEVIYPANGWSEQNPAHWWDAFISGVRELICGIDKDSVTGIAVAGQMHGLVALDKDDNIIRNAILWNDGRTGNEVEYLNTVVGKETLSDLTANIAFAGFTAPKILWLYENERDNFDKIAKIMLPKDYINYKLTGVHATDFSDASGMLLLDVKNRCWSKKMLDICRIDEDVMPTLFESYDNIGTVKADVAELLGLGQGIAVAAGAGDNAAAAIGTGVVGEGGCNISLGTSGTVFISSEQFSLDENNALHSFCHADGGYHLMGCILSAASCNKWLCDKVYLTNDYARESARIDDSLLGNNDVYFLPYLMGERSPLNDTDARGMLIGLTPDTGRDKITLAVLEGVAFAIRDNIEVVRKLGINLRESFLCGGGARSAVWRKILASVLDMRLNIPACEEGPGYGAAILAMVASGNANSVAEAAVELVSVKETVEPDEALVAKYEEKYKKFKKIYPSVKNLYKALKEN